MNKLYILYADDDTDDQLVFAEIVAELPLAIETVMFDNGLHVVRHLEALAPADPLPVCVILDLNMPLWDGMKTLQAIRKLPRYQQVPILIFSTSSSDRDRERCLQLGATAYLCKPNQRTGYSQLSDQLMRFIA
jgi:CheY-like chemotaxis protein